MRIGRITAVCALAAALACAPEPSARECARPAQELVSALQSYVDGFAGQSPEDFARGASVPQADDVATAVAEYRHDVRRSGCSEHVMQQHLASGLVRLRGRGVIAETIATALRARLSSARTFGNTPVGPETRRVKPSEDLAAAVASVVPGSRIVLDPGVFRLDNPLILFDGVSLTGSGRERTRIVSRARGAAITFFGNGSLRIEKMTIAYEGSEPSSLVMIRSGSWVIRDARITGARRGRRGAGGVGLLAAGADPSSNPARRREARIENSEFVDNETAGITIGGGAPSITNVVVRQSDGCGVCYIGRAGGVLRRSRITSNTVGVLMLDRARPSLERNTFAENRIGVQVRDRSRPALSGNSFAKGKEAAVVFFDRADGRTVRNSCDGRGLGIVLLERAAPSLAENRCEVLDRRGKRSKR